jgi:hypothetical protein
MRAKVSREENIAEGKRSSGKRSGGEQEQQGNGAKEKTDTALTWTGKAL